MKTCRTCVGLKETKRGLIGLSFAVAVMLLQQNAVAGQAPVPLGSAGSFAVLAGSTVTSTGGTTVAGDLGVWAGSAVTGFAAIPPGGPGTVNGTIHAGDAVAQAAQGDLTTAYNDAAGRTLDPIDVSNADLGGQTLTPGLYKSTGTLAITGNLTLDAQGDPNAVFIFQVASSLNTASGSQVILSGSARAGNVFWQVGSSATLGTTTVFKGNILADQSISLATGVTLDGRVLARIGAVTLDSNTIVMTVPVETHFWTLWWQNSAGGVSLWRMNGTNRTSGASLQPANVGTAWRIAGTPDFTGNGHDSLLFQRTDGHLAVWFMNDIYRLSGTALAPGPVPPSWKIAATVDFTGQGKRDILWQNDNGSLSVWFMDGTNFLSSGLPNPSRVNPSWKIVGTGDFNDDGKQDILWQNDNGALSVWFMDGTNRLGGGALNPPRVDPSWRIVATADVDGDNQTDIIWQNSNGALAYWHMNGTNAITRGPLNPSRVDPSWRVVGPR